MAKITGNWDFRTGGFADKISGTVATLTSITSIKNNKGLALKSLGAGVFNTNIPSSTLLGTNGTIECAFNLNTVSTAGYVLMSQRTTANSSYLSVVCVLGALKVYYLNNAGSVDTSALQATTAIVPKKDYHVIVKKNGATIDLYVNGVLEDTVIDAGTAVGTGNFYLSSTSVGANNLSGSIYYVRTSNEVYSQIEIDQAYANFVNSQPISKPKRGFIYPKPTDLSYERYETVGSEQGALRTWAVTAGTPVVTGDTIVLPNDGAANTVRIVNFWTIGKTYKISVTVSNYSGTNTILCPYDGSFSTNSAFNADGTYIYNYTPTGTHCYIGNRTTNGATVTVNSIQEISGLVAAYNMQPTGLTLTDISGNNNTITLTQNQGSIARTVKGVRFNGGVNGSMTTAFTSSSFSFCGKCINDGTSSNFIIGDGGSSNYISTNTTGAFVVRLGGGTALTFNSASPINREFDFVFIKNGTSAKLYIDGALFQEQTFASDYSVSFNKLPSYNSTISTYFFNGELIDARLYNRILSVQDVKDYHNSFAKQVYISEDFSDQPADGNAVVPTGWTKVSGAFKIGEYVPVMGELVTTFSLAGITGVSATGYTHAYTGGSGTKNVAVMSGASSFTGTTGRRYIAKFTLTINSGSVSSPIVIGGAGAVTTNLSAGSNTWNIYGSNGANGVYFTINSTTDCNYTISNFSLIELDPLPNFTKGQKYLECTTAGVLAIPSQQAFGTWEFDWLKGAGGNTHEVTLVSSNTDARASGATGKYGIIFAADEAIYLTEDFNSYLTRTATSYFTDNTWYRVKITRSTAGVFTTFLKGGALVPTAGYDGWTLISVTGGSGANPTSAELTYTTSNYLLVNIDAADRLTNLKLINGVIIN